MIPGGGLAALRRKQEMNTQFDEETAFDSENPPAIHAGKLKEGAFALFRFNEPPYWQLLIGGVAVILFYAAGINAVVTRMFEVTDMAEVVPAHDNSLSQSEGGACIRVKCPECSVVESGNNDALCAMAYR
jgi:hypothetical protein